MEGDWLRERARRTPRATALEGAGERIDYAGLDRRVDARARALAGAGVEPGAVVASAVASGVAFAELAHAARRRGAVLMPLNSRLREGELAHLLDDAAPRLLVHDGANASEEARAAARGAGLPELDLSRDDASGARGHSPIASAPLETPSTLIYTSGTTGRPKGALLSHRNFLASAVGSAFHLGALPSDRWLACLPLFHVGGLSILWRSVLFGSAVVVHDRFDPERVVDALVHENIHALSLTATMLARVLDTAGDRPLGGSLRFALLGGGPCPAALCERALAAGVPVHTTYGLTEAASQVATETAPGAGATALLGSEIRIAGDDDAWLGPEAEGEICVRGPTVMRGYLGQPEASAAALRGGWLRTGDVGALDAMGVLRVLDRRRDLIVSGGENVYPAEVEAVLLSHPAVAEAGVAGVADATWGARPCAWWVARPDARADADGLRRFCRERLAGYKVPVAFHRVDELPRTAAGKLQRHALEPPPA